MLKLQLKIRLQLKNETRDKIRETGIWLKTCEDALENLNNNPGETLYLKTQRQKCFAKIDTLQSALQELEKRLRDIDLGKYDNVEKETRQNNTINAKDQTQVKKEKKKEVDKERGDYKDKRERSFSLYHDKDSKEYLVDKYTERELDKEYEKYLSIISHTKDHLIKNLEKMPNNRGFTVIKPSFVLIEFGAKEAEEYFHRKSKQMFKKPIELYEAPIHGNRKVHIWNFKQNIVAMDYPNKVCKNKKCRNMICKDCSGSCKESCLEYCRGCNKCKKCNKKDCYKCKNGVRKYNRVILEEVDKKDNVFDRPYVGNNVVFVNI